MARSDAAQGEMTDGVLDRIAICVVPDSPKRLGTWLLKFDPMSVPGALSKIALSADVSACVWQGNKIKSWYT